MYSKVGFKERFSIILILTFVFIFGYLQVPKKTIEQAELIETKIEKKEILVHQNLHPKKKKFLKLLLPILTKVHQELYKNFESVKSLIENEPTNSKIEDLKTEYDVTTNEELLIALKPHSISIALAQAAIESAWGTSRFFKEANNLFGVWSFDENEPRISASQKREELTIYLKKFENIEEAIRQYYKMFSTKKIYFDFKKDHYFNNNPIENAKKLVNYSEQGENYTKKIISVLKYNKFTQYDRTIKN